MLKSWCTPDEEAKDILSSESKDGVEFLEGQLVESMTKLVLNSQKGDSLNPMMKLVTMEANHGSSDYLKGRRVLHGC